MKTLRDVLPTEAFWGEYENDKFQKFLDVEIVSEHCTNWVGNHKNVYYWWNLSNGYAVGWNENPSRGWSFPVVKMKK